MAAASAADAPDTSDTRQRILDAAMRLFVANNVAGTSMQMIADALGVTKAAIFYHFQSREQLVLAAMEPHLADIRRIVDAARRRRSANARADAMISGYAALSARNRAVGNVLAFDAQVTKALLSQPEWAQLIDQQLAVLVGEEPSRADLIKAHAVFRGLAGAAMAAPDDIDEEELRDLLTEVGRRMWGLRVPRRQIPRTSNQSEPNVENEERQR